MPRFAVATAILIAAAAVVFFSIVPQWQQVSKTRAGITRFRLLHEELKELAQLRDDLSQDYNAISEDDFERLSVIAPNQPRISAALVDLETLSTQHGVSLERIDFSDAERGRGPALAAPAVRFTTPIPMTMGMQGSYDSLRAFLIALERNLRVIDLNEVSLTTADGASFTMAIRGAMYYHR